jgi:hypothetical protein
VKRAVTTSLTVASVTAAAGWADTITAASGPRVRVLFRNGGTGEVKHFGVAISSRGTFTVVATSHRRD